MLPGVFSASKSGALFTAWLFLVYRSLQDRLPSLWQTVALTCAPAVRLSLDQGPLCAGPSPGTGRGPHHSYLKPRRVQPSIRHPVAL